MNYYFEDFTEVNYRIILEELLNKEYEFVGFDYANINLDKKIVLWRHDVDFSLNRAYKLAEIEEELGIKATYFIHIQSNFYNLFEPNQYEIVKGIINKGHAVGLHFDYGFYTWSRHMTDNDEIEKQAVMEKEMLENYFGIQIGAVSFHNPEANCVLDLQQDYYGGGVNAYSQTISNQCKYCSDSNGYWRYDRLQNVIENGYKKLHVLTHPVWWVPSQCSPYERVKRCADGRREAALMGYCDMLSQYGRENITCEEQK